MKICVNCKIEKQISCFYPSFIKQNRWFCKTCQRAYVTKYKKENILRVRQYSITSNIRHNYNISRKELKKLEEKQKYVCMICKKPPNKTEAIQNRRLHIDHCHKTKKIRGLLCHLCNRGLGLFKDDPERLKNARIYILRHLS